MVVGELGGGQDSDSKRAEADIKEAGGGVAVAQWYSACLVGTNS